MARYDEFAAAYNADINELREHEDDKQLRAQYQTLKPTHRELFNDLVMELGKNMLSAVKIYEKLQKETGNTEVYQFKKNTIVGNGYFVCSTNRYQLSKHSTKEQSTISRNIQRLMDAGVIAEKVGHGHFSDFDLHINADFLIVSDKANPNYNPLTDNELQNEAFLQKIAFCKANKKEKEHLKYKIYSDVPSDLITTASDIAYTTGTFTGTGESNKAVNEQQEGKARGFKATGGAVDVELLKAERGYDWRLSKQNPGVWHAFHRLSYAAMFVDYLIEKIYHRRAVEIFPDYRLKVIEYAEMYYFPSPVVVHERAETPFFPCETIDQYANRLSGLKWCVDAANRYNAKHGGFFELPLKYIDVAEKNGLITVLEWFKSAKQNEKDKATHSKNVKDVKNLNNKIRLVLENPDAETFKAAESYVKNNLNKYLAVFHANLTTIKTKFINIDQPCGTSNSKE
jgi:hypothetical protein